MRALPCTEALPADVGVTGDLRLPERWNTGRDKVCIYLQNWLANAQVQQMALCPLHFGA